MKGNIKQIVPLERIDNLGSMHHGKSVAFMIQQDASLWQKDLTVLADTLRENHANLYHTVSKEQFDQAVKDLSERIPHLQGHEIIVEMSRIVSMVGDGHTSFRLPYNTSVQFHRYPLRFYQFADGIVVSETDEAHRHLLGAVLKQVGSHSVDDALTLIKEIVSRDNEVMRQRDACAVLNIPEVLHALRIIPQLGDGDFTLQNAAGETVSVCPPMQASIAKWFSLSEPSTQTALWQKYPERSYWFEYLEEHKLVYVNHRVVRDMDDETIAAFCERLFAFVDTHAVERFVLDLRRNGGGNNYLNPPLVHGLICSGAVNQWGRLFTIIGPHTFSAAMNLAVDLERNTKTLFVGERTGASPNHYGENYDLTLPHSGIALTISMLYWQSSVPNDKRRWITPHLPIEMSSVDYRNGIDPVLEGILAYEHDPSNDHWPRFDWVVRAF